jgi:hypothetical protein
MAKGDSQRTSSPPMVHHQLFRDLQNLTKFKVMQSVQIETVVQDDLNVESKTEMKTAEPNQKSRKDRKITIVK